MYGNLDILHKQDGESDEERRRRIAQTINAEGWRARFLQGELTPYRTMGDVMTAEPQPQPKATPSLAESRPPQD